MNSLDGRVALVTGASRGIGAAVARALDAAGVRLALASRSGDNPGIRGAVAQPCDVRDSKDLEAIVAATVARFGGLDILVVNAGVGAYGPFLDLPIDQLGPLHQRLSGRRGDRLRDRPGPDTGHAGAGGDDGSGGRR